MERDLWDDEICALVDAAFETVSRNPSDHETAVAYRRAIAAALTKPAVPDVRECCEAERERCAKIAEDRISAFDTLGDRGISSDYIAGHEAGQDEAADHIATAIRGADQ